MALLARCTWIVAIAMIATMGCQRESAPDREGTAEQSARGKSAATTDDPLPTDPLLRTVYAEAARLAPHMVPLDRPSLHMRLETGQRQDGLAVLQAGRCFKIFGAGGRGVEDFDLVLYDGDNVQIQQDLGEGSRPMLGATSSICPREAGSHRIEARMVKGAGEIVVQVFRTEP